MNAYERQREERIQRNKLRMQELGLLKLRDALAAEAAPVPRRIRSVRTIDAPVRRSGRATAPQNYCENRQFDPERKQEAAPPTVRTTHPVVDNTTDAISSPSQHTRVVRVQGGRIYDSEYGVTCHWCRQKTTDERVTCTQQDCRVGKLPVTFCQMCLRNRHGEQVDKANASGEWVCPSCRGSCGEGCTGCCNCGPCRKKAGLAPTHQMIKQAREAGFTNVHDYLIYRVTGESQENIASRKAHLVWCKSDAGAKADGSPVQTGKAQDSKVQDAQIDGSKESLSDEHTSPVEAHAGDLNKSPPQGGSRNAQASENQTSPVQANITAFMKAGKKGVMTARKAAVIDTLPDILPKALHGSVTRKQKILQAAGLAAPQC